MSDNYTLVEDTAQSDIIQSYAINDNIVTLNLMDEFSGKDDIFFIEFDFIYNGQRKHEFMNKLSNRAQVSLLDQTRLDYDLSVFSKLQRLSIVQEYRQQLDLQHFRMVSVR